MSVALLVEPVAPDRPDPDDLPRPPARAGGAERVLTSLIIVTPILALAYALFRWWGEGIGVRDLVLAALFYVIVGHGITVGFHRLMTHRSFTVSRRVKIALAIIGSMAFQGGPIGWVADHRRHHAQADRPGDPHSPHGHGPGLGGQLRGLWPAHVGWLLSHTPTSWRRYASDLLEDRDLMVVNRLFPVRRVVSLALPFGIGYLFGGLAGGLTALLWAGAVRICLLHHITWSVNSICHMVGRRPFETADRSRNVAALAVLSFGESWHNGHHAFRHSARHGIMRGQWDSSAMLISLFERLGWATNVHRVRAPQV